MSFQSHAAIPQYQATLARLKKEGHVTEEQTRAAFERLLTDLSSERGLFFTREHRVGARLNRKIDGVVKDGYSALGYWEAKDAKDKLEDEIEKKIALEYPTSNTIFEDTQHAILYQHAKFAGKFDLSKREEIGELLDRFFGYTEADAKGFAEAVKQFLLKIPELSQGIAQRIEDERNNEGFKKAFDSFFLTCQLAINPQIKESAVKEMLVQHLLTERLFKKVFDNEKWFQDNIIAREIDYVIDALSSGPWNRSGLLKKLDPFFNRIEDRARDLPDYHAKQEFLNSVYEQFLQAYSPDTADTMGIVYTPQEIVDWMCQSVETVLQTEFSQSLATPGVQILDPCTGTGNFLVNVMRRIPPDKLPFKYGNDLHANELMLLPYYVASGNIEHEYFDLCNLHAPFKGLCFQDTLDLTDSAQAVMFAEENSARVARQKAAEITVIIGNPPYNVGQKNENDNNKNRQYKGLKNEKGVDDLIKASYAKSSRATLQNKLYDPYVRFFKWASERLGDRDGVICFVSNNSFVDKTAFDGMRFHLAKDFTTIYHLDLKGNANTSGERRRREAGNIFSDTIKVGIGITILIRNSKQKKHRIFYHAVPDYMKAPAKKQWLVDFADKNSVPWIELTPNAENAWLTEGLEADFETLVPMGSKEAKASFSADAKTIFKSYSLGIATNRDAYAYDFDAVTLTERAKTFVEIYQKTVEDAKHLSKTEEIAALMDISDKRIKWTRQVKADLIRKKNHGFEESHIRQSVYRPFCKKVIYSDDFWNEERYQMPKYFPLANSENRIICVSVIGAIKTFSVFMANTFVDLNLFSDPAQCFPLYTYSPDGSERFDNLSPFALETARAAYGDSVTREDVFYACYALLHHTAYRAKYGENLKRELPRLPLGTDALTPDSWRKLVEIGRKLGDLHVGYESATPFAFVAQNTTPQGVPYSFRVEKMSWKDDKTKLRVNGSILLSGFTPEMFAYKLGNRSALDWVVESYRVKKDDARSGLTSDPNRDAEPNFILDLIGRVATVSLETQRLIGELPGLFESAVGA